MQPTHNRGRADGGQVTPIVAALLVLAAVLGLALLRGSAHLVEAGRARTAADAAALAGAADGRDAARRLAVANGATLVAFARDGDDVVVTVAVGGVRARARARASWLGGTGVGDRPARGWPTLTTIGSSPRLSRCPQTPPA